MNTWRAVHCRNCDNIIAYTYEPHETVESFYCFLCAHSLADVASIMGGHNEIAGVPGHNSFVQAYRQANSTLPAYESRQRRAVKIRQSVLRWLEGVRKLYPSGVLPIKW